MNIKYLQKEGILKVYEKKIMQLVWAVDNILNIETEHDIDSPYGVCMH